MAQTFFQTGTRSMTALDEFFTQLDRFPYAGIFDGIEFPWDPLKNLVQTVEDLLAAEKAVKRVQSWDGLRLTGPSDPNADRLGPGLCVERGLVTETALLFEKASVLVGPGTVLEPTAIVKGPAIIGAECEIRQGAYLRGGVLVGDHCVVGHATEVKGSLLMGHTEAGHFNYIGDSILGFHINLGAGARLANFQFRSARDKHAGTIHPIHIPLGQRTVDTGLQKLGAILGDHVEVGCNAVLSPGTLIGRDSWIYPNLTVPKGYYAPHTVLAPAARKPKITPR